MHPKRKKIRFIDMYVKEDTYLTKVQQKVIDTRNKNYWFLQRVRKTMFCGKDYFNDFRGKNPRH